MKNSRYISTHMDTAGNEKSDLAEKESYHSNKYTIRRHASKNKA